MNPQYDIVIAGAGLAGASAAMSLAGECRVLLIDAGSAAAGASGAGAGLINPLLGRRARPVRGVDDALAAVEEMIHACGAGDSYDDRGVVRPAEDDQQAERFQESAILRPDLAAWLTAERAAEEFPDLRAPHGALRVLRGGAIDIRRFVDRMIEHACRLGADFAAGTRLLKWDMSPAGISVELGREDDSDIVLTGRLVLAVGNGFEHFAPLRALELHRIKGQTIRIRRPAGLTASCAIPPISGSGYIVPEAATWVLGSTYEHSFESTAPTLEADRAILEKTSRMIPTILDAKILERRAGVRVTVPKRRLPMVGPLDDDGVWFVGGLGSKGLLHAPLIARSLGSWMREPSLVPPEFSLIFRNSASPA